MGDVFILALGETVIRYVDDRYGRIAAWLAAIAVIAAALALAAGLIWWIVT